MNLLRRDESCGVDGDDADTDDGDVDDDGYVTCTCQGGMKAVVWMEMMMMVMSMMDASYVLLREGLRRWCGRR